MSSNFAKVDPLPWRPVAVLCLCAVVHFYSMASIFSYGGIMCVDLGWAADENSAGFVAGYLQSSNALARVFTSSLWGLAADRFGRKASVMLSLVSITLGGVAFGLCTNLVAAVAVRTCFFGLGNGWVTVFGPLSAEVAGSARQSEVIGKVIGSSQITQMFAPALGGWTYGITSTFPGSIPSFVTATLGCVITYLCWLWLPGDLEKCKQPGKVSQDEQLEVPWYTQACTWPINLCIVLRALVGFVEFGSFDLIPLWAISSKEVGGLELSQTELGYMLSVLGLVIVVFSFYILHHCTALGLRRAAGWATGFGAVAWAACPFSQNAVAASIFQVPIACARAVLIATALAMTTNATPEGVRASVNGIAVMLEAFGKGFAPVAIANIFAWSLSRFGSAGRYVAFFMMSAVQVVIALGVLWLPDNVEVQNLTDTQATQKTPEDTLTLTGSEVNQIEEYAESTPISSEDMKTLKSDGADKCESTPCMVPSVLGHSHG